MSEWEKMKAGKRSLRSFSKYRICLLTAALCVLGLCWPAVAEAASLSLQLRAKVSDWIRTSGYNPTDIGIYIVSLPEGRKVYGTNASRQYSVASNMKLITTACALTMLGPDYTFQTKVYRHGTINKHGVLRGNLLIRGKGDPNISGRFHDGDVTAVLKQWIRAVKKQGIAVIQGDIVADDAFFDRQYVHPSWPRNQLSNWYAAQISALSLNDNCIDVTIVPGKRPGDPARISIAPDTKYVTIINRITTTQSRKDDSYSLQRREGTNTITLNGKVWIKAKSRTKWVTVHNPALFLTTVFKEMLEREGIEVYGMARVIGRAEKLDERALVPVVRFTSTLGQTVNITNKRSQNFYAEQILKTLGAERGGSGTFSAGSKVLNSFLRKIGIDPARCQVDDGCGLSRNNRFSPRQITTLLSYMHNSPLKNDFVNSLSISGVDGSMKKRLTQTPYRGKVFGKTGHIYGVSCLSGYVRSNSGSMYAFSILFNNSRGGKTSQVKKLQDDICKLLVDGNSP